MAITMLTPTHVGYGYICNYFGASGPIPAGDYMELLVQDVGSTFIYTAGVASMRSLTSGRVLLGFTDGTAIVPNMTTYVAPGAACILNWSQKHAGGATVASGSVPALLWDPTGALGELLVQLLQTGGGSISAILAAVTNPLPTLP